ERLLGVSEKAADQAQRLMVADDKRLIEIPPELESAMAEFQKYDSSLRRAAIESEHIIDAGLLSLLSAGHMLVVGGPGNGKSYIVQKMLENILFTKDDPGLSGAAPLVLRPHRAHTEHMTSLFKLQLTNSTTFSQLFGNINNRRLFQEDGDHERRLGQGILTHAFGFLDEFFDAEARLLRAQLNLLNEREFSEAGITHYAQTRTVFATSNYYLPEVYLNAARKQVKLEAVLDRFRYIVFAAKDFANTGDVGGDNTYPDNYMALFDIALNSNKYAISPLHVQSLRLLQQVASQVVVPSTLLGFWKRVSSRVDSRLALQQKSAAEEYARAIKDGEDAEPPYRVTKSMTKRTKGAGAVELRALVALDWIRQNGQRPLVANFTDVLRLQYFSGLVGNKNHDLDVLIGKATNDKEELAMLRTVKTERDTFVTCWEEVIDEVFTEFSKLMNSIQ
ncbi:MAG: AAA family ATPase, partial [Bdellovibrionales bacterium]